MMDGPPNPTLPGLPTSHFYVSTPDNHVFYSGQSRGRLWALTNKQPDAGDIREANHLGPPFLNFSNSQRLILSATLLYSFQIFSSVLHVISPTYSPCEIKKIKTLKNEGLPV